MTSQFAKARRRTLICGAAIAAVLAATPALAQEQLANIDIAAQPMDAALKELAKQSGANLLFSPDAVRGLRAKSLQTTATPEDAARMLLAGTDLFVKRDATGSLLVDRADPQSGSAGGDGADGTVAALIVTAQKREEQIQDVPIAISAFTEKSLEEQKIEGGFDLLKAIPNVTFSKNNFSGYNFSIRGIGTKAISVTTDPGVAVEFNSTALIRNRLFEQEYFDVERVEVLRGPQGTLHGRNATAGVINVISAKPDLDDFDGWIKGEVGNYHTKRLSAMINIPLAEDKLAVRFAGALTNRDGYDYNATTKHAINGRDLWSARLTIGFQPTDNLRAGFIWERFNEDDDRSRTGKQLCHHDAGPDHIGAQSDLKPLTRGVLSQGCLPGSLYDDNAFGTPNGLSIPFVRFASAPLANWGVVGRNSPFLFPQTEPLEAYFASLVTAVKALDPYGGMMQSRDLRVINSIKDPKYRANTDVFELNVDFDITPSLTVSSQTAYVKDEIYSFQDYNRFNTVPIFSDTSNIYDYLTLLDYDLPFPDPETGAWYGPSPFRALAPGGIYCDPQLGCSDSLAGFDISQARSTQFSQEFRIQSDFEGAFNFSAGANYTRYRTVEDYYVFYNLITMVAQLNGVGGLFNGSVDINMCHPHTEAGFADFRVLVPTTTPGAGCVYIDPNPIESIDGEGHNYFRSKNPYSLQSKAAFGEFYWQFFDTLKMTFGLRYTDDQKTFTPVPSQVLLTSTAFGAGTVGKGYPALPDIEQQWGEFSGRLGVDWKPDLSFTDETLLYAFYSRGYKGGGANPPGIGYEKGPLLGLPGLPPFVEPQSYPPLFDPEFVNAYEIGAKNTLLSGGLILNGGVFYYDYKDYQVSQIKERTAVNENFDAKVWGLEFESIFMPSPGLRLNAALGYQDSSIADGEESIDLMDRTQGHSDWVVVKPFVNAASNCIAPLALVEQIIANGRAWNNSVVNESTNVDFESCGGGLGGRPDLSTRPNNGAGFSADLSGNKLPNAPHWTASFGAQYGWNLFDGSWRATVRGDAYWQSQSWARVYNDNPYDKLHGWYNLNLSVWLERPEDDLKIEFYAKNLLDKTPITDAFLNSDDTALTTNVFTLDPRLIGLSIKKGF